MRESDYLQSISSSAPSAQVTALLQQPVSHPDAQAQQDRLELFIARSGITFSPLCYVGLCIAASFSVFLLALGVGPITGISAGLVTLYLGVIFVPVELFARRIRRAEGELPKVLHAIGERLSHGCSLDQALVASLASIKSPELREIVHGTQRRLLVSPSLEQLAETGVAGCHGGLLSAFITAMRYAARHSSFEGGSLCVEYSRILAANVKALRAHSAILVVARSIGLVILALVFCAALGTGFWAVKLGLFSIASFSRDLGAVVLLLSVLAVLRVTSLAEWERYG